MWTDFNNSFTFGFVDKLRNTIKENIPPLLNYIAALPGGVEIFAFLSPNIGDLWPKCHQSFLCPTG